MAEKEKFLRNNPAFKVVNGWIERVKERVSTLEGLSGEGLFNSDEINAIKNAASPSEENPLATMADIPVITPNPKMFVAFITQTGTAAPTVVILKNDLGSYTLSYGGVGIYNIVFDDPVLVLNKTVPNEKEAYWNDPSGSKLFMHRISTTTMRLNSKNSSDEDTNGLFDNQYIYFEVYS